MRRVTGWRGAGYGSGATFHVLDLGVDACTVALHPLILHLEDVAKGLNRMLSGASLTRR